MIFMAMETDEEERERVREREMGSEAPNPDEASSKLSLSFFSLRTLQLDPPSLTITSPTRAQASVPFLWEEVPGKPRTTSPAAICATPSSLKLPPRLLADDNFTNIPSPAKTLVGPYVDRSLSCLAVRGPALLDHSRRLKEERGNFGSWRKTLLKGNEEDTGGDSFVLLRTEGAGAGGGDVDTTKMKITKTRRSWSVMNLSHANSHFWASIYGSFKQVVPWSRRK